MANITEILGTDSVSSSRPVINSNFELLNDELASITALLDPTTSTLSNVASVSTGELSVTGAATITTAEATFNVDSTFTGAIKMGGKIIKNGTVGSFAVPSTDYVPGSIAAGTYFIDGNFTIPTGLEGQEVTFVCKTTSLDIIPGPGVDLTVTSITLAGQNATVTLRCFNNRWFVISSYNATIL